MPHYEPISLGELRAPTPLPGAKSPASSPPRAVVGAWVPASEAVAGPRLLRRLTPSGSRHSVRRGAAPPRRPGASRPQSRPPEIEVRPTAWEHPEACKCSPRRPHPTGAADAAWERFYTHGGDTFLQSALMTSTASKSAQELIWS